MYLLRIKKELRNECHGYAPGEIYLIPEVSKTAIEAKSQQSQLSDFVEFAPLHDFFNPLNLHEELPRKVLLVRHEGIGDLIALSAVCARLACDVMFYTRQELFPVFEWYESRERIELFHYTKPLFANMTFAELAEAASTMRVAMFDDSIEQCHDENWYCLFHRIIGADVDYEFCRPHLLPRSFGRRGGNIDPAKRSIVIAHRANANMRIMAFETVYTGLVNGIGRDEDCDIYVHCDNLTRRDAEFIKTRNDGRIKVVRAAGVAEYLRDLFEASLVVTVDSAAVHFREGVEKPVIAIYASFAKASRTAYYKHTFSFDVESPCDRQPCFLHQKRLNETCHVATPGSRIAPCLDPDFNSSLNEQVTSGIKQGFALLRSAADAK